MVRVTESALAFLRELRDQYGASGEVPRIVPGEDGKGFRILPGKPEAGDESVDDGGVQIAAIEAGVASALAQASLVSQMTPEGQQLAANTPQPYPFGAISEIIRLPV